MEPLLLICEGCGAKIRAGHPDRARGKTCPRCAFSLASAVDRAVGPQATTRLRAAQPGPPIHPFSPDSTPSSTSWWRPLLVAAGAASLAFSTIVHLLISEVRPPGEAAPTTTSIVVSTPASPRLAIDWPEAMPTPSQRVVPASDPVLLEPNSPGESTIGTLATLEPRQNPSSSAALNLVIPDGEGVPPPPPRPADRVGGAVPSLIVPPPPATSAMATEAPPNLAEPRRLLVRDSKGRAVVAREHGMLKDQMAVVLPDGTIGWPTTLVFTDDPFVPSTIDEMERTLQDEEYATFRVIKTPHYLIFYQSTERFARDSADLLEKLHENLTAVLRKKQLPVTPAEFPLVAVIFRTEDDFRANRQVPAEVQAYYEILSNRIYFYEKSNRESTSPELALLRKPQTVAHEGTHQVLHNVGIQPRMSPWPLWLVEGLAEYCSPPRTTKKGVAWAGLGQVNSLHLTTIRDLNDPMSSLVQGGPKAPSARDRNRPMVEYLATRTDLNPTDYALSWGLTHYLAQKQVDQFVAYIRKLNRLRPFQERTPDEQLADFREAFGDLAKLDAKVRKHLDSLPDSQALPFYAVLLEQTMPSGVVRRMAMVSQSPSVIHQWVGTVSSTGGQVQWQPFAHPNRTQAVMTANGWTGHGR